MRFAKLELAGAPTVELPLHRRMTVVGVAGEAERLRLAEALAGRARGGVVWAFDDEDPSEEQVPIGDFGIFGLSPDVQVAMLLRTHDIPVAEPQPVEPDPATEEPSEELETAVGTALTELRVAEESARDATDDDARRIAAEWDEVATALAATPAPGDEDLAAVEAARTALAERREELACARLEAGQGPVSPEDATRIEHLHSEVTNAQARADRPFPGSAARRRLAEAEAAEAKFLQELGFSSYSAYLLDAVVRPVDPEPLRRLSSAERAVAEAEAAWQELAPVAEALHEHQSLQRQAGRLREQAVALLGFDPGDAVAVRLADWLAARRAEAAERAAREAELAALQRAEADRAARAARAEALQAAATAAHNADAESLDAYLAARLAVHRSAGAIGSLPIILEDAFATLAPAARMEGLAGLAEMSAAVQVIYLTTDPDVVAWAATMPSDEVGVRHPAPVIPPIAAQPAEAPAAPVADAVADTTTRGPLCMECHHDLAVGECDQCGLSFCGDHLVRMKRTTRPPLCLSCALVAAGARRGRR